MEINSSPPFIHRSSLIFAIFGTRQICWSHKSLDLTWQYKGLVSNSPSPIVLGQSGLNFNPWHALLGSNYMDIELVWPGLFFFFFAKSELRLKLGFFFLKFVLSVGRRLLLRGVGDVFLHGCSQGFFR